ncbi:MAG: hypothetical protein KAS32_05240 [Candidatus Peribacteraceae bacterium]|nr:hypothetical protein [Candidatus Peribacteraceae bacterium]
MNIGELKKFESRLVMMNPREKRAYLESFYHDLMGYSWNYSNNVETVVANSPHLLKAHDKSLKREREFIEYAAKILKTYKKYGFEPHANKLLDSYSNHHLMVDIPEGHTAENRTRVIDRLMGISERAVLFPNNRGKVVQLELHKNQNVGFCVSDEIMTREESTKRYSLENFPMGISGTAFGIKTAQKISDAFLNVNGTRYLLDEINMDTDVHLRDALDVAFRSLPHKFILAAQEK